MWWLNACKISSLVIAGVLVVGCQSSPKTSSGSTKAGTSERPLKVIRSADGVQDIDWEIKQIQGQKARYYRQMPSLRLNSAAKLVQGHTGCNNVYGQYTIDNAKRSLTLMTKAGYQSCDNALAQEADLADALQRVQRYQQSGQQLNLLDARGQVLIQAERK
jgi:heat shock protein HslJ